MDAKPPLRIVLAASDISINYRLSLSMDIFISYRRQDTSGYALGLRRLFRTELPSASVFLDIDSIDAGGRWREVIRGRLSECDVMLVLIGDEWLVMRDGQKKLEQADDPVRFELEYVLRRNVRIIPILVEEAKIPSGSDLPKGMRQLCEYNAHAIHDQTYDQDVTRLVQTLRNLDDTESEPPPPGPQPPGTGSGATFPSRITERFLEQEVGGMGRDQLLAFLGELRRRGWSDKDIYEYALGFSPLQPPQRFPRRITPLWLATNVPLLSADRIRQLTTVLRQRGWSAEDIRAHVFEHRQGGLAEQVPARIRESWLDRNAPLMTISEQTRLAKILLDRGWKFEDVRYHLPYAQNLV